jgi:hypothetical protein
VAASGGRGGLQYVSEASLVRIYRFAEFEEAYQERDPLNNQRFEGHELKRMRLLRSGVFRYVRTLREHHVIGGRLVPRDSPQNETEDASMRDLRE